jgi:hypothetical protein
MQFESQWPATTLHPEFFLLASEQAMRERQTGNAGPHRGQNPIHLSYADRDVRPHRVP